MDERLVVAGADEAAEDADGISVGAVLTVGERAWQPQCAVPGVRQMLVRLEDSCDADLLRVLTHTRIDPRIH